VIATLASCGGSRDASGPGGGSPAAASGSLTPSAAGKQVEGLLASLWNEDVHVRASGTFGTGGQASLQARGDFDVADARGSIEVHETEGPRSEVIRAYYDPSELYVQLPPGAIAGGGRWLKTAFSTGTIDRTYAPALLKALLGLDPGVLAETTLAGAEDISGTDGSYRVSVNLDDAYSYASGPYRLAASDFASAYLLQGASPLVTVRIETTGGALTKLEVSGAQGVAALEVEMSAASSLPSLRLPAGAASAKRLGTPEQRTFRSGAHALAPSAPISTTQARG